MTDQEVLEYIKAHLRDYDKAFGSNKTLLGLWVDNNPELEAWVRELLGKPKKTFLDDLPTAPEDISIPEEIDPELGCNEYTRADDFKEAYDELNESWQYEHTR